MLTQGGSIGDGEAQDRPQSLRRSCQPAAQQRSAASARAPFDAYLLTWSFSHEIPLPELQPGKPVPVFSEHMRVALDAFEVSWG